MKIEKKELDVIIPIAIELDWPNPQTIINDILEQNKLFGFTKFALAAPCGGWRKYGFPPLEKYVELAHFFLEVKNAVQKYGIECGWWITTTVICGNNGTFTHIITSKGTEINSSCCPLDPDYRKAFCEEIATFAKIAKPAFIFTEDDYTISRGGGCFCKHHLEEFSKRTGIQWTRESLAAIVENPDDPGTEENEKIFREWLKLKKDSMVLLSSDIRKALDKESPEINMGLMEPGTTEKDGDITFAVSKALAGKNHIPFCRFHGTYYNNRYDIKSIASDLYHLVFQIQRMERPFTAYHESDTYPHTKFYTTGAEMRALMGNVYSLGYDGSTHQTQQLLDCPNEEKTYGFMFAKERKRYNMVHSVASVCNLKGAQVKFEPFWAIYPPQLSLRKTQKPVWVRPITDFGLPYTTLDANFIFWDEKQAKHASEQEVKNALSKVLFLDGDAAKALEERGFSAFTGVTVGPDASDGFHRTDLAAREVIREEYCRPNGGHNMPSGHMFSPLGTGKWLTLNPVSPNCKIISEAFSFTKENLGIAMTEFKNSLGGTVVVMGETLFQNLSHSLFNYRRMHIFHDILMREDADFAFPLDAPKVYTIMNIPKDAKEDFCAMLTLTNFCSDNLKNFELYLPKSLRKCKKLYKLNQNGKWIKAKTAKIHGKTITVKEELNYLEPLYLLFR